MPTPARNLAASLLLLVAGLAVALLLAEVALRSIGFAYPKLYVADEHTGSFFRPGVQFTYTNEGRGRVTINSAGLRDREHELGKPPGVFRIAVLGDSFAAALEVDREQTFWAVLEAELNACRAFGSGVEVEVINFGVPNFGTAQELLTLRSRAAFYEPDLVLLAFLSGNDVRNNSRRLEPDRRRPFFSLGADGTLVADMSFRDDPDFQETLARRDTLAEELLRAWRLPQLIRRVKGVLKARQRAAGDADAEPGMDDAVYLDEPGQDWDEAWAITEALLAEMRIDVARLGARFLVVTLSNGIQVHPQAEVTESFMRQHGIGDIFRPELRVAAMGQRQGFEALALAPELQPIARRERVYLHGFVGGQPGKGHWNVDGHRHAGELIAGHLCRPT